MPESWVIKLPLTTDAGGSILIHITPKDGNKLDLDLLATDGESAFKGKGTESRDFLFAANTQE
jgi:hypothetical protein